MSFADLILILNKMRTPSELNRLSSDRPRRLIGDDADSPLFHHVCIIYRLHAGGVPEAGFVRRNKGGVPSVSLPSGRSA